MKLVDLEPQFVSYFADGINMWLPHADSLADAHGIKFLCPKCFGENNGPVGTHAVICWFRGRVPDDAEPNPGRWDVSGTDFTDLTLSPSIALVGGCQWHGFIINGNAT